MNEVINSIFSNAKEAYKESIVIDNEKLQDLLITILADAKKLEDLNEDAESNMIKKKAMDTTKKLRYTYEQVKEITKIELKLAKELIPLRAAEEEILKIAPHFPVHNMNQYNKRLKNCLSGIGEYGFAFPSNWAKALLELTDNDELVIQALRQQQELYLEKDGKNNQTLETLLDSLV